MANDSRCSVPNKVRKTISYHILSILYMYFICIIQIHESLATNKGWDFRWSGWGIWRSVVGLLWVCCGPLKPGLRPLEFRIGVWVVINVMAPYGAAAKKKKGNGKSERKSLVCWRKSRRGLERGETKKAWTHYFTRLKNHFHILFRCFSFFFFFAYGSSFGRLGTVGSV